MILDACIQQISLLYALILGITWGIVYDLLRAFRLRLPFSFTWLFDFLYCFFVIATLFLFAPYYSNGYIRATIVISAILGFTLYYVSLGRLVRKITQLLGDLLTWLVALLVRPFILLGSFLTKPLEKFSIFLQKSIKKIFSFPRRWFTMRKMPKDTNMVQSQEEAEHEQFQNGWFLD